MKWTPQDAGLRGWGCEGVGRGGWEKRRGTIFDFFLSSFSARRMSSIHSLRLSYRSWSLSRTRGSTYRRRRGGTTRSTRSGWASRRSASARRNSRWVWPPIWLLESVADGRLEGLPQVEELRFVLFRGTLLRWFLTEFNSFTGDFTAKI